MVLLPGCSCCASDCPCSYPDFIEIDFSYSAPVTSCSLKSVTTYYYGVVSGTSYANFVDDVYTETLSVNVQTFANRTYRLNIISASLDQYTGAGQIRYAFTNPGELLYVYASIRINADLYGCIGRSFEIESVQFHSERTEKQLYTGGSSSSISFYEPVFAGPSPKLSCSGSDRSQSISGVITDSTITATTGWDSGLRNSGLSRGQGYPYYSIYATNNPIAIKDFGPQTYSGTSGGAWPFTKTHKRAYRINKLQTDGADNNGGRTIVSIENGGFTKVTENSVYAYYTFDYTLAVLGVRFGYGETMADFPSAPDYGPAP